MQNLMAGSFPVKQILPECGTVLRLVNSGEFIPQKGARLSLFAPIATEKEPRLSIKSKYRILSISVHKPLYIEARIPYTFA